MKLEDDISSNSSRCTARTTRQVNSRAHRFELRFSSASLTGGYCPRTKDIYPNVSEWGCWVQTIKWKVSHLLLLTTSSQFSTFHTVMNAGIHKPSSTNQPKSCTSDSRFSQLTPLVTDFFMKMTDDQDGNVMFWNDDRVCLQHGQF